MLHVLFNKKAGENEQQGAGVYSVTISRDGNFVISGDDDQSVKVWNVAQNKPIAWLRGHKNYVSMVALSQDQTRIFSCGGAAIKAWDILELQLTDYVSRYANLQFRALRMELDRRLRAKEPKLLRNNREVGLFSTADLGTTREITNRLRQYLISKYGPHLKREEAMERATAQLQNISAPQGQ